MEWTTRFRGWIYHLSISLTLLVLQRQKSLLDIDGTTIQDVGPLAAIKQGVHTMSDELILQISCNIFLAFKLISVMVSGQNISHYTTAKLSVMCEITTGFDNKTKLIHKPFQQDYDYELLNPEWNENSHHNIKAQMPSNPNQKSRAAGRQCMPSSDEMFQRSREGYFLCLFPELRSNEGNLHKNNTRVSAETVRHESTYIILFLARQNGSINDDKKMNFTRRRSRG